MENIFVICWSNKNGERDYQECVDMRDVNQCLEQVVLPGGGIVNSIRVHEVTRSLDVQTSFSLVPGRTIFLDY